MAVYYQRKVSAANAKLLGAPSQTCAVFSFFLAAVSVSRNTHFEHRLTPMRCMRQHRTVKSFSAVARNLRALRGARTQAEFAAFLGIANQQTYHRYESGRVPKAETLRQIAGRIGITVDELLTPLPVERIAAVAAGEKSASSELSVLALLATHHHLPEASSEAIARFATPDNLQILASIFRLREASRAELARCLENLIAVTLRAPAEVLRFYWPIRMAIVKEIEDRLRFDIEIAASDLTESSGSVTTGDVKAQWPELKKRLRAATAAIGAKSKLAEFLKVDPTQVSQWLSKSKSAREPGAEYALQMLRWCEQQERQ